MGRVATALPELPEVETIRRGLAERLVGRRIRQVHVAGAVLRRPSPLPLHGLAGRRVEDVRRHAKHLFWDLDDGTTLAAHLGMTGKFLFVRPEAAPRPHTHLRLDLDGEELWFTDPRRFGFLCLHPPGGADATMGHYGIDALDPALTDAHLAGLLAGSRAPLKSFLLDQSKVSGIGNIYACEALWRAGLSPRRRACNTPRRRVPMLREAIVGVLRDSLAHGGSSFNDYVDAIGRPGSFLLEVAVFRRAGRPCPRCGGEVRRMVQSGRSTFWCPGCQR